MNTMYNPRQLFTRVRHDLARLREAKTEDEFERCKSFVKKDFAQLREYLRSGTLDEHDKNVLAHSVYAYESIVQER